MMRLLLVTVFLYACDCKLIGSNLCTVKQTYPVEVQVSVLNPYQMTEYYWCLDSSFRCKRTVTKFKIEYEPQKLTKQKSITQCCNGFKPSLDNNNSCIPHCSEGCDHGECVGPDICECYTTYGGPRCNVSCPLGLYGNDCEYDCLCKNNSTCDALSGKCRCLEGWKGIYCQHQCMSGTYGDNCLKTCKCKHGDCHHVTGTCTCHSGWTGKYCDTLIKKLTEIKKTCHCLNGGTCSINNATCTCTPGWFGNTCEKKCNFSFWGPNCTENCLCSNGANCDHITGTCICPPGFTGDKCSNMCSRGTYGKNCMFNCNCNSQGKCSEINGTCTCFEGWSGITCNTRVATEVAASLSCQCSNENYVCDSNRNCVCPDGVNCDINKTNWWLYGGIGLFILTLIAIGIISNCVLSIRFLKKTNMRLENTETNETNAETSFTYDNKNNIKKWKNQKVEHVYQEVNNEYGYNGLSFNDPIHPRSPHYQAVKNNSKINNININNI